jgi:methionine synthase II (cobalamin-independent)
MTALSSTSVVPDREDEYYQSDEHYLFAVADVAERITRLARLMGRENLIASTDCGFAQGPFVRRLYPTIMWAKLSALVAGARLASAALWGRAAG